MPFPKFFLFSLWLGSRVAAKAILPPPRLVSFRVLDGLFFFQSANMAILLARFFSLFIPQNTVPLFSPAVADPSFCYQRGTSFFFLCRQPVLLLSAPGVTCTSPPLAGDRCLSSFYKEGLEQFLFLRHRFSDSPGF